MEINKKFIENIYSYFNIDAETPEWLKIAKEEETLITSWKIITNNIKTDNNLDHFVNSKMNSDHMDFCRFLVYGSPLICGRPNVVATNYGIYPFVEEKVDQRVLKRTVKYETGKNFSKNAPVDKDEYDSIDDTITDETSKANAKNYYIDNIRNHLIHFINGDLDSIDDEDEKYFSECSSKLLYKKAAVLNSLSSEKFNLALIIDENRIDKLYDAFDFDDGKNDIDGDISDSYKTWYQKNERVMSQAYKWLDLNPTLKNQWCINNMLWELANFSDISKEKPNIIYYGAPGTGKTYNVEKMVKFLTKEGEINKFSRTVQCHPGFGYEEFIEGIKPVGVTENGRLKLQVVSGVFKKLCIEAINDFDNYYYFVADEINRANLSEMFGETLSLLESAYRCKAKDDTQNMRTTSLCKMIETVAVNIVRNEKGSLEERLKKADNYLKENSVWYKTNYDKICEDNVNEYCVEVKFGIPSNIIFIGMMNDVDKSIDSFDLALRRRFIWIPMSCDYEVAVSKIKDSKVAECYMSRCKALNEYISKRDNKCLGLGRSYEFGHSYFLKISDYLSEDNSNLDAACSSLFNDHLRPLLLEYLRSYKDESQIEIGDYLAEAGKRFSGDDYEYHPQPISAGNLRNILDKTNNIILYGNPGNGKTHSIYEMLKMEFGNDNERIRDHSVFVQCHPGFGYEEFMEGIKPTGINEDGSVKFEVVNGVFKDLCIKAKLRAEKNIKEGQEVEKFFFIADEINRANLSAMFGESLSLIEQSYRYDVSNPEETDNDLHLRETPLSPLISNFIRCNDLDDAAQKKMAFYKTPSYQVKFGVPNNVYIIGTMNDVDRSIDSFDLALRRRFNWIRVECDYDLLKKSERTRSIKGIDSYIKKCKKLNNYIASELMFGETYQFGISVFLNIDIYVTTKSKQINKTARGRLFDETISSTLREYCRNFIEDDLEIEKAVKTARGIFV